jgi:HK97 gp10 family phage protein
MTTRGTFTLSALEDYLEKIQAAGNDVDAACAEALEEAAPIVTDNMHELLKASSETWTGETDATIEQAPAKREGNYVFVKITAAGKDAVQGFYKEFGTARQAAEPFFRPGITKSRHRWRNKLKEILKAKGFAS